MNTLKIKNGKDVRNIVEKMRKDPMERDALEFALYHSILTETAMGNPNARQMAGEALKIKHLT